MSYVIEGVGAKGVTCKGGAVVRAHHDYLTKLNERLGQCLPD